MLRFRILIASLLCAGMFCLAQAQVPMTGAGKGAPGGGGGGSATFTLGSAATVTTLVTQPNFTTTLTFNTGASDVPVVFLGMDLSGSTLSSVTINGTSATCVQSDPNGTDICYIAPIALTTASVVATFGSNVGGPFFAASGKVVTTHSTPFASSNTTGNNNTTGGVATSLSANVATSGVGLTASGAYFGTCTLAATWSGATSSSGDSNASNCTTTADAFSIAHTTTAGTPASVSSTWNNTAFVGNVFVTWQP